MEQRVKYPHTLHVMWSPGSTSEDKFHYDLSHWLGTDVVISEKMDGENTTLYSFGLHARSPDSRHHESRNQVKEFHSIRAQDIPYGWRVCGENMTAVHSLRYEDLESVFLGFSLWNEFNHCIDWDGTQEWFRLLGIRSVPELYRGPYTMEVQRALEKGTLFPLDLDKQEGYVIRPVRSFPFTEFGSLVGKYVRKGHVQTDAHWMSKTVEYNGIKKG